MAKAPPDLSGQRIGRLTVLSRVYGLQRPTWKCLCDCGREVTKQDRRLREDVSCGCSGISRHKAIVGTRYGRLLILKRDGSFVICKCDCGTERRIIFTRLPAGNTRSCGCLQREVCYQMGFRHGASGTRASSCYQGMLTRCYNPSGESYKNYGGRGIKVCDRWLGSFESFLADMGHPPPDTSIERLDNNADYSPDNCVWATRLEQALNKRTTRRIEFNGAVKALILWCRELGICYKTAHLRFMRGWPPERILCK